jgi:hypothetical protein
MACRKNAIVEEICNPSRQETRKMHLGKLQPSERRENPRRKRTTSEISTFCLPTSLAHP